MRRSRRFSSGAVLSMDSMVDIVFQLLIFFLFTFQIRLFETVVPMKMTSASPETETAAPAASAEPSILELEGDRQGSLTAIRLNGDPLSSLKELPARLAAPGRGGPRSVTLRPHPRLHFDHVIQAAMIVQDAGWTPQLMRRIPGPKGTP
jgi:biopolymer transport protein ExbD